MDYKVTGSELTSIADAIRAKGSTSETMSFPDGFISAISAISGGGTPAVLESLTVSQNGHYTPSQGVDGFDDVIVNVSGGGGSNDNFLIAIGASIGSIYDTEASVVREAAFAIDGNTANNTITGVTMTNVKRISGYAFQMCKSLTEANFPECSFIGVSAFTWCSSLSTISFPKCETIGSRAFYNTIIGNADFPECTIIESYAFSSCAVLSQVSFPKCTTIKPYAFTGCHALSEVSFPNCTTLGQSAFQSASIITVSLASCSTISADAFYSLTTLKSIDAPLLEVLSGNAIFYNTRLNSVSFPRLKSTSNATSYGVFGSNPSLSTAYFEDLSYLGGRTFWNCTALMSVYLLSNAVATLANVNAFQNTLISVSSGGVYGSIYVPASLVDSYKVATNWSVFADRITAYVE